MVRKKIAVVIALILLGGCAAESAMESNSAQIEAAPAKQGNIANEPSEVQKSLDEKYTAALTEWVEKSKAINDRITKTCKPLNDKKFVKCLNKENQAFVDISFFPEISNKRLTARKVIEQQLLQKKISRQQFFEQDEQLHNKMLFDFRNKVENDVKKGIYTGKY